jgi:hypothetical protein
MSRYNAPHRYVSVSKEANGSSARRAVTAVCRTADRPFCLESSADGRSDVVPFVLLGSNERLDVVSVQMKLLDLN